MKFVSEDKDLYKNQDEFHQLAGLCKNLKNNDDD
jgi:hypothetical protein